MEDNQKPPRSHITIAYGPESAFPGFEVVIRTSVSLTAAHELFGDIQGGGPPLEILKRWGDLVLVSWNARDEDGNPLPANGDGLLALPDYRMAVALVERWREATDEGAEAVREAEAILKGVAR